MPSNMLISHFIKRWKTGRIVTTVDILPLSRHTNYEAIDDQVCFHGQSFARPVKPRRSTTGFMELLRGTNKAAWGVKLLLTTVSSCSWLWQFLCPTEDTAVLFAFTGDLLLACKTTMVHCRVYGATGALKRLLEVSNCYWRLSCPTRLTVAVSVPYWRHSTAVFIPMDGFAHLLLPTPPPPSALSLPPSHPYKLHLWYCRSCHHKMLGDWISYKTLAIKLLYLCCEFDVTTL